MSDPKPATELVRYGDLRIGDVLGEDSDAYVSTGKEPTTIITIFRNQRMVRVTWASDAGETHSTYRYEDDLVALARRGPDVPRMRNEPGVATIVAFLNAQIDADIAAADANTLGRGMEDYCPPPSGHDTEKAVNDYLDRYAPERALAEAKAKRELISELTADGDTVPPATAWTMLRLMAAAYDGRRGYDPKWRM